LVVLIVEDEPAPLQVMEAGFTARHYRVATATTGARALELVAAEAPDVMIVDLGLPDIDGLDLCRHLRLWTKSPIVVVTADGSEQRMIQALDEGADDYVTKPFSMPELLARVRVAVRHGRLLAAGADEPVIAVGSLTIDVDAHEVRVDGNKIDLSAMQFQLLTSLARNSGRLLTYRQASQQLWGSEHEQSVAHPLRILVSKLRRQLGSGPNVPTIVTEPLVGYRLVESDAAAGRELQAPSI
jgi:two-component system, OmpR family, KDP operon response regulator KdpE